MQIENIQDTSSFHSTSAGDETVARFIGRASFGTGIEELMLENAMLQRRVNRECSRALREQQKRKFEKAIAKMKSAANDRFSGAFLKGLIGVLGSITSCMLGDALASRLGERTFSVIDKCIEATADFAGEQNCCNRRADAKDREALELRQEADYAGSRVAEFDDWLQGLRKLEQRMLDTLEKSIGEKHRTREAIIGKISA